MSYEPVKQQESSAAGVKEVELEGSETDIEANPPDSEDSFFLGWKRRKPADSSPQGLYHKAIEANVPVIVSLHFLVLNLILSIALGSLLWKSIESVDGKSELKLPAGELLYSQSSLLTNTLYVSFCIELLRTKPIESSSGRARCDRTPH